MSAKLREIAGFRVLDYTDSAQRLESERDATTLIGDALGNGADCLIVPVSSISAEFFKLRLGLAGAITQKFVNYGGKLAIIGDVSHHIAASTALRDFVTEANRGKQLWFLPSTDEFEERLSRQ